MTRRTVLGEEHFSVGDVAGLLAAELNAEPGDAGLLFAGRGRGELAEVLLDDGRHGLIVEQHRDLRLIDGEVRLGEGALLELLKERERPSRPGEECLHGALLDGGRVSRVAGEYLLADRGIVEGFEPGEEGIPDGVGFLGRELSQEQILGLRIANLLQKVDGLEALGIHRLRVRRHFAKRRPHRIVVHPS